MHDYLARKFGIVLRPTPRLPEPTPAERVADSLEHELLPAIDAYLLSTHSSTWGRNFSIDSEDGRQRAAAYILNTMRGVSKELA